MKNVVSFFIPVTLFFYAGSLCAYSFSFSNHTNKKLNIRIQMAGIAEPWLTKELGAKDDPANRTIVFEVGGRKVHFCLDKIQVSAEDMPWTPAFIQWVEGEDGARFDRMLKAAEHFADGAADIAQIVAYEKLDPDTLKKLDALKEKKKKIEGQVGTLANLINASPEELAELSRAELDRQVRERFIRPNMAKIKEGNAELIAQQQNIKRILDEMAIDELDLTDATEAMIEKASAVGDTLAVTTKEGSQLVVDKSKKVQDTQPYNYAKRLASASQQSQGFRISDIIHVIGNLIKYSWCKSLHFDVVEDSDGIKFLVKVGQ